MACGSKGLRHAMLCPRQDVAAGAHRAPDQHRLTGQLIGQKKRVKP